MTLSLQSDSSFFICNAKLFMKNVHYNLAPSALLCSMQPTELDGYVT